MMLIINATDARRNWSAVIDDVIRDKPHIIKRTRDQVFLADIKLLKSILTSYSFTAKKFTEEDGSVTLSLNEIDIIENGDTEDDAKLSLAKSILEYAEEYYNNFSLWSSAPNRKSHIPYVLRVLIIDDVIKIGEMIECQVGKN